MSDRPDRRAVLGAALVGLVGVLAAIVLGPVVAGSGVCVGATVAAELARRWGRSYLGPLWVLPALAGPAFVLAPAPLSLPSAALALLAGLALLAWAGLDAGGPAIGTGLLLPGLTGALGVLALALLPVGRPQVGLAAALLVLLLLALAGLSATSGRRARAGAPAS